MTLAYVKLTPKISQYSQLSDIYSSYTKMIDHLKTIISITSTHERIKNRDKIKKFLKTDKQL
jgi:YbbR domain-containing protein